MQKVQRITWHKFLILKKLYFSLSYTLIVIDILNKNQKYFVSKMNWIQLHM